MVEKKKAFDAWLSCSGCRRANDKNSHVHSPFLSHDLQSSVAFRSSFVPMKKIHTCLDIVLEFPLSICSCKLRRQTLVVNLKCATYRTRSALATSGQPVLSSSKFLDLEASPLYFYDAVRVIPCCEWSIKAISDL